MHHLSRGGIVVVNRKRKERLKENETSFGEKPRASPDLADPGQPTQSRRLENIYTSLADTSLAARSNAEGPARATNSLIVSPLPSPTIPLLDPWGQRPHKGGGRFSDLSRGTRTTGCQGLACLWTIGHLERRSTGNKPKGSSFPPSPSLFRSLSHSQTQGATLWWRSQT